jgi:hypothetical protein
MIDSVWTGVAVCLALNTVLAIWFWRMVRSLRTVAAPVQSRRRRR